jgi:hypothetical protein
MLIILAIIAFALFLFNRFFPGDGNIKQIINYVVIFVIIMIVILAILRLFGVYNGPALNFR